MLGDKGIGKGGGSSCYFAKTPLGIELKAYQAQFGGEVGSTS